MKWNVGVRNPHDLGIKSSLFEMVTVLKGKDFLYMKKKKKSQSNVHFTWLFNELTELNSFNENM